METRRDVFQALADPTRREIISLVAEQPLSLNMIAGNFSISRPAISQHIKILNECGLLIVRRQGRERYCEVRIEKLQEVSEWLEKCKVLWNQKLDALGHFLKESDDEET